MMLEILWSSVLVVVLAAVAYRVLGLARVTVLEYQRGLLYRKGRYVRVLQPGQYWISRFWTIVHTVDSRRQFVAVPVQELLSKDGVSLKITIAAEFEISDPAAAINKTANFHATLYSLLQLAIREIVASYTMEAFLEDRGSISAKLLEAIAPKANEIGLKVCTAEIKDIMLPGELKRVFTQVLQAQKEGLAALEKARGETAALRNLANAARLLEESPGLLQLRMLQAVGSNSGNTIVFGASPDGAALVRKPEKA